MRRSICLLTNLILLLAFATTSGAGALPTLDLTGTWTGKGSCKGLLGGEKVTIKTLVTVEVSHDTAANEIAAEAAFTGTSPVPVLITFQSCGFAEAENAKPERGRAALHGYDGMAPFDFFGTGDLSKVSVFAPDKKGRTGKMSGTVFVGAKEGADIAILTCKLTAARVSDADPAVPGCTA
jgi:hypothetical protein